MELVLLPHFFLDALASLRPIMDIDYDAVSASVIIWVPKSGESKSGQMVSEKVKWA